MPKIVDHDTYRSELLAKAVQAFAEKGFAALSMKQLADAIGVSHGLFYHYFSNKEDLFLQMMEQLGRDILLDLVNGVDEGARVADRLDAMMRRMEARDADLRRLFVLATDYVRLASPANSTARAGLAHIVEDARLALRDALGVSEEIIDMLFTYAFGVVQSRILRSAGLGYAEHRSVMRRLLHLEARTPATA
jgi:AcrR family transcriptional regulator